MTTTPTNTTNQTTKWEKYISKLDFPLQERILSFIRGFYGGEAVLLLATKGAAREEIISLLAQYLFPPEEKEQARADIAVITLAGILLKYHEDESTTIRNATLATALANVLHPRLLRRIEKGSNSSNNSSSSSNSGKTSSNSNLDTGSVNCSGGSEGKV